MARRRAAPADDSANTAAALVSPAAELEAIELEDAEAGDLYDLADPQYSEWKWWVYRIKSRPEMAADPGGAQRVVVTKVMGPLDVIAVQEQYGGGVFEFWGFVGAPQRLRRKIRLELHGDRKSLYGSPVVTTTTPAPAPAATPVAPSSASDARMDRLEKMLERVLERPVAAAPRGMTGDDVLRIMQVMRDATPAPAPASTGMHELVEVFKMGAEIRESVEPKERGTLEIILEKLVPTLERVGTVLASRAGATPVRRAPAPPPGGPTPGAVPSSAEVVTEPEPTAEEHESIARMVTLVGSLARAIAEGREPADFCDTVEDILTPAELLLLADPSTTTPTLLASMNALTQERHKAVLSTDAARVFVDAVLLELRATEDDDSAAPAAVPPGA